MTNFNFREDIWYVPFFHETETPEEFEERITAYKVELKRRFQFSPEGQAYLKREDVSHLMWAEAFTDFAIGHIRTPLWIIRSQEVREILYDIFPEKVMVTPDQAPYIVDELRAFWEFINREFQEDNAKTILKIFNEKNIVKRLTKELDDERKYGMAKSIMMPGIQSGLDVTDQNALQQYMEEYNTKIEAKMNAPIPEKIIQKRDEIIALLTPICKERLNQDYLDYATEIAEIMAENREDAPLSRGQAKSWAAAIVYALGQVNFLSDPADEPYMRLDELCKLFGVSQQTASTKAKTIREGLGLYQFHPEWTISNLMEDNPLIWMFTIDGMPMDIRTAPREIQVIAYEQGLIPYIPADRQI